MKTSFPPINEVFKKLTAAVSNLQHDAYHKRISHREYSDIRQLCDEVVQHKDENRARELMCLVRAKVADARREARAKNRELSGIRCFENEPAEVMAIVDGDSRGHRLDVTRCVSELIEKSVKQVFPAMLRMYRDWEYKHRCERPELQTPDAGKVTPLTTEKLENVEAMAIAYAMFHASKNMGRGACIPEPHARAEVDLLHSAAFTSRGPYRFEVVRDYVNLLDSARTRALPLVRTGAERVFRHSQSKIISCLADHGAASDEEVAELLPSAMFSYCIASWLGPEGGPLVKDSWTDAQRRISPNQRSPVFKLLYAQLLAIVGEDPRQHIAGWHAMTEPPRAEAFRMAMVIHGSSRIKTIRNMRKMLRGDENWMNSIEGVFTDEPTEATRCCNAHIKFVSWYLSMSNTTRHPSMIPFLATWIEAVEHLAQFGEANKLRRRDVERLLASWVSFDAVAEDADHAAVRAFGKAVQSLKRVLANLK